jgi:hypothetical protein
MLVAVALFLPLHAPAEVDRLVRQVRTTYSTCKTYRDSGTQTIWRIDSKGAKAVWGEWKFATIFARPKKLRLEVSEREGGNKWMTSVLWTTARAKGSGSARGEVGRLHMGLDGSEHAVPDLEMGLISLASLCFGIANQVPRLLMPSDYLPSVLDLYKWKMNGAETINGRECSVLTSTDSSVKLWIDKRTSLLLQQHEKTDLGGGLSTLKAIQFTPSINAKVEDKEFKGPR